MLGEDMSNARLPSAATTPEKSALLAINRPSRSNSLIVYFNGYGKDNRPGAHPDKAFATKLQNFRGVTRYDAHAIWFVENGSSWYLEHEDEILTILKCYVVSQTITTVKFIGSSAGGYAAIRMGSRLDTWLKSRSDRVTVLSFAVNPQTGFRPALFSQIETAAAASRWTGACVGVDPIVMSQPYLDAYRDRQIELRDFLALHPPRDFGVALMYDSLNPIDTTFAQDLAHLDFVIRMPTPLRMGHVEGCAHILTHEIWKVFDKAFPIPLLPDAHTDLRALN
jgi:hypothetical protein